MASRSLRRTKTVYVVAGSRSRWRTMDRSRIGHSLALVSVAAAMAAPRVAHAIEYRGQVSFGGLPVPGATITATQGAKKFAVVTDQGGVYRFADLADGAWAITVEMQCFVTMRGEVTISAGVNAVPGKWELVLLPLDELLARTKVTQLPVVPAASAAMVAKGAAAGNGMNAAGEIPKPKEDAGQQSNDGFLVNGSSNNAATLAVRAGPGRLETAGRIRRVCIRVDWRRFWITRRSMRDLIRLPGWIRQRLHITVLRGSLHWAGR